VLLYDIPQDLAELNYRIVMDGLWMSDPFNPHQRQDVTGMGFSRLTLDNLPSSPLENPRPLPDGRFKFTLRLQPGQSVAIMGDFNRWDPYTHPLHEESPGQYTITLRVLPGRRVYTYLINGRRFLDPYNIETAVDYEGYQVSTFIAGAVSKR
jgi:hypothetical protein